MLIRYLSAGNTLRLGVLAACMMQPYGPLVFAQTKNASNAAPNKTAAEVTKERDATRQMIESVNVDKAGVWDNATTLGTTLKSTNSQKKSVNQNNNAIAGQDEPKPLDAKQSRISIPPIVLNQWPQLSNSDNAVGRIARKRRGQANQDDTLTYTPDFSRQKLTFGVMINTPYIDLPDQQVNESNSTLNFDRNSVDVVGSKNLSELIKMGLANSQVMDQAQAQIDIAVSRRKQARSELLPKASARYQQGQEKSEPANQKSNTHTTKSSSLRLSQPLINLPAMRDWMAELSNEQASIWRSYVASESVALSVTNAVIGVASSRMVMEFTDEQLVEFNNLLNYVESRNQSGAASAADLERIRARVLQARQSRIEQQAVYRSALLELERLVGIKPTTIQLPYLNQLPGLPATQTQLRQMVWENSQDLRVLRKDIQVQEKVISSIYSRLYPTVSLNLEKDDGQNVRGVNARQTDTRAVGVLSWEFSLGGKEFYAAKLAEAELANRQSKLAEEEDRIMQGVDADFALLQSATLRIATGQAEQDAAMIVLQSLKQQMKTGRVGSMLEAMDANERYFNARQRLVQTLAQQMQAQTQLLRRLGMLSQMQNMVNQTSDLNSSMSVVKSPALIDKLELKKTIKENKKSNEIQDPVLPKINTDNSSQSRTNTPAQMVDKPVAEVKEIPDAKGINSVNLEAMTPLNEEKKSSSTETNISVSPQNSKRDIAPDSTDEFSIEPLEIKN